MEEASVASIGEITPQKQEVVAMEDAGPMDAGETAQLSYCHGEVLNEEELKGEGLSEEEFEGEDLNEEEEEFKGEEFEGEDLNEEEEELKEEGEAEEEDNEGEEYLSDLSFEFCSSMCLDLFSSGQEMLSADELFFDGKLRLQSAAGGRGEGTTETTSSRAEGGSYGGWSKEEEEEDQEEEEEEEEEDQEEGAGVFVSKKLGQGHGQGKSQGKGQGEMGLGQSQDDLGIGVNVKARNIRSSSKTGDLGFYESPRCVSMSVEGSRGRSCVSLNTSRSSSPSRSFSGSLLRDGTTPPLNYHHYYYYSSRRRTSFSHDPRSHHHHRQQLASTPTSPTKPTTSSKASASVASSSNPSSSSSQSSSSKFLDFFKLTSRKHNHVHGLGLGHAHGLGLGIGHGHGHANPSKEKMVPRAARFWPFSRSNSAGESKSRTPPLQQPPLPPRSNSAGESKTASSFLLPINVRHNIANAKKNASLGSLPKEQQQQHFGPNPASAIPSQRANNRVTSRSGHIMRPSSLSRAAAKPTRRPGITTPPLLNGGAMAPTNLDHRSNTIANHSNDSSSGHGVPKGLVRDPKDLLSRDVRVITPLLNVNMPSKSKIFNLGTLFSKKDKGVVVMRGYNYMALSPSNGNDPQSGG